MPRIVQVIVALLLAVVPLAAPAQAQTKVRFAYGSISFTYIPFYLAEDMGFLKAEGIDYQTTEVAGSGPAAAATIAGSLDFFVGIPFTAARAIAKGAKLATFAMIMRQYGTNIVVSGEVAKRFNLTRQTPIEQRLDVLKGLRVASWTPGGAPDLLVRFIAAQKGWNPETDMTLLPIGGSAPMLAALENKRVDAFALSSPTSDEAVSRLGAFLLFDGSSGEWAPLNGAPYMALIGNTDWLHKHEKTAVAVYRALARGLAFLREHPAEARDAIRKRLHQFDDAAFRAGYDSTLHGFPETPAITMATAERVKSFIETVDHKTLDVPAAKMVNMRISELASKK